MEVCISHVPRECNKKVKKVLRFRKSRATVSFVNWNVWLRCAKCGDVADSKDGLCAKCLFEKNHPSGAVRILNLGYLVKLAAERKG